LDGFVCDTYAVAEEGGRRGHVAPPSPRADQRCYPLVRRCTSHRRGYAPQCLAPDRLTLHDLRGTVNQMDVGVFAFVNEMWDLGFRAGRCMEHVRLTTLHRELNEFELMP
jgi:hypothetical protein